MADELYVDPDRIEDLVADFDSAVSGIGEIASTVGIPQASASLIGSATALACYAGGRTARNALSGLAEHYRHLHTGTRTSPETYQRGDAEFAARLDKVHDALRGIS